MELFICALAAWNTAVFLIYGWDKLKSKGKGRRVSERALLSCAFLFGAAGALLGMLLLRHKTKHMKFKVSVPLALALNAAAVYGIYVLYFK